MRIVRLVLSAALGTSALVGIQILATDYWLWSAAPTHAQSLAPAIENSKKLSLEIHLPVFRLHSSSVSTAYRRCGIVIDPPTIRPTLKASKNSSSVTLVSTHWMIWYVKQSSQRRTSDATKPNNSLVFLGSAPSLYA